MLPDLIVVTDLDATLLDHYNYSFSAAEPALRELKTLRIPVILNSSKTSSELLKIRRKLRNSEPFIVENGAAVLFPTGDSIHDISFGSKRVEILSIIQGLREQHSLKFIGFADMSVDEVSRCTGLEIDEAALALERQYTEPILWNDSEEQMQLFRRELNAAGLALVKGGRFWHVSGVSDKGVALTFLCDHYFNQTGVKPLVIALGDSENDLAFLKLADYPVLVKSPARDFPKFEHQNLRKTKEYGPIGWSQAVLDIIGELRSGG